MEIPALNLRFLWLFLVPNILLCSRIVDSILGGNETDRLSLLAFKDEISSHDPLGALRSWNDSLHFCEWGGVTCGRRHRRVTTLDLTSQKLVGSISPSIGNLSFLRGIFLQDNNLYGEIPQEIGLLSRLQELVLYDNFLEGEIPFNLSSCPNLKNLNLSYNELEGKIPVALGSLSKLTVLSIRENNLLGRIPSSLGNLSSLNILALPGNALEGSIPDALGQLTNLTLLSLSENMLSGLIPPSLYNFSSLTVFSVTQNRLYGSLPQDIGFTLSKLQFLYMGGNQLGGTIPVSLSNISNLEILEISHNNLVGAVPVNLGDLKVLSKLNVGTNKLGTGKAYDLNFLISLTNCTNLGILGLNHNNFGGELPTTITNLSTKLTILTLGRNQISGRIPTEIENLVNLTKLGMEENLFTGSIPIGIGNLKNLAGLSLKGNMLSGQIPASLGNLTRLSEIYLADNNLRGSIPSSLGECKYLICMNLSLNNLNGTIPEEVIGLSSLSLFLDLSFNSLTGPLPLEVGRLKNLAVLNISENKLSGEIPYALGDCVMLEVLSLEGNFFQGNIPPSLKDLQSVQHLDLSRNNLSGGIPKYFEKFSFLQYLNLSSNQLEGDVPREGNFKNMSKFSVDGNAKLCGGVPELELPACPNQESKKKGRSLSFKVRVTIIVVVLSLILIPSLLTLYLVGWKSRKNAPSTMIVGNEFLRVSYDELFKATSGLAPTNLIGVGSFGSVYKGILRQDEKHVAVKVLNLQQKGASKSFIAECEALGRIRHRNLLKIITSCSSVDFQGNDFKALVYEFMPNGSLENWLHPSVNVQQRPRNLNLGQRLDIAIGVASALDYLHHHCSTPIVHCDLKPSNVLLDEDLTAHVGDFGLAKFLSWTSRSFGKDQTSSITLKGSIGYVAPEYGMGSQVSTKGDVYSYGVLLLETFTAKRPTEDMFKDGLSLRNFSLMALPEKVMEIVDSSMLLEEQRDEAMNEETWIERRAKIQECLATIFKIGVACCAELPNERMNISDVLVELNVINEVFLGLGIHGGR